MSRWITGLRAKREVFRAGMRDCIPIALGYFVVSFTLGIAAHNAGLTAWQSFWTSFFNMASAGEYAAFTVIAADAPYWEMALITLVANIRYSLMSTVLSQRFSPSASIWHRIGVGACVTDEIFGITISRRGMIEPAYNYGAIALAVPAWSIGTALGVLAGDILPPMLLSSLSVALYGMFIAIIIPPGKVDHRILALVVISFLLSVAGTLAPILSLWSASTRTIVLTILIAGSAAYFLPMDEDGNDGT
ncbi:hypothetical protein TAMA11512_11650 [Selenomonas sp. TAMA-11512]|uniref:AzlC family ABC transporter permease n=1 Tax=Selenomonas sp. TAMA-11512 TaxID=3095337 RepID=UPI00308A731E|nr:hypothetical protein TAMA11512_11650 [Selenomonas sp. TAMA-11512]